MADHDDVMLSAHRRFEQRGGICMGYVINLFT